MNYFVDGYGDVGLKKRRKIIKNSNFKNNIIPKTKQSNIFVKSKL